MNGVPESGVIGGRKITRTGEGQHMCVRCQDVITGTVRVAIADTSSLKLN